MNDALHSQTFSDLNKHRGIVDEYNLRGPHLSQMILAFWFGPATAVKFGPLGQHWLGFMDGATEA